MGAVCVLVGAGIVTIHKTGIVACFVRRCTVVVGFGFIVSSVAFCFFGERVSLSPWLHLPFFNVQFKLRCLSLG